MDELIDKIRAATAIDATDDARAAGAEACRTLLIAFEANPEQPIESPTAAASTTLVQVPTAPTHQTSNPHAAVQAIASALRGMTPDQLLDLAIVKLRAALPPGTNVPAPQPLKFQLIPINADLRP